MKLRSGSEFRFSRDLLEENMRDAGRRPMGRLFYWALAATMTAFGFGLPAFGAAPQTGANTTTVSDTVFMADKCLNASTWAKGVQGAGAAPTAAVQG
jgi:hypothetical protein